MRFLCLVYFEPHVMQSLSQAEGAALREDSRKYDTVLRGRGQLIAATPLRPVETAVTVRTRGGKVIVTDGAFAESKEVLGGFLYIDADSMAEATAIAAKVPMARYGSIEVRPTQTIEECGLP